MLFITKINPGFNTETLFVKLLPLSTAFNYPVSSAQHEDLFEEVSEKLNSVYASLLPYVANNVQDRQLITKIVSALLDTYSSVENPLLYSSSVVCDETNNPFPYIEGCPSPAAHCWVTFTGGNTFFIQLGSR